MTMRHWPYALLIVVSMLAPDAFASSTDTASPTLLKQRQLFSETRQLLARGQITLAKKNMAALHGYPLYPYLELTVLSRDLDSLPRAEVDAFLARHADSVAADQLHYRWLAALARNGRWADYLDYYRADSTDRTQQCWHAEALFRTGKTEESLRETAALWPGLLTPDACKAAYSRWLASEQRDETLVWNRLLLSLSQKREDLARALSVEIREPYKNQAGYALLLYRDPGALETLLPQVTKEPEAGQVISLTLKNLAPRGPDMAAGLWRQSVAAKQMSAAESHAARSEIGRQFIIARGADALPWLVENDPTGEDSFLLEWRIRLALRGADWPQLAGWIEQLPAELAVTPRWRYWYARSLAEQRDDAKQQQALTLYTTLAGERSYYGFLAADLLKTDYQFNDRRVQPTTTPAAIARRADVIRAREFLARNEKVEARREWQRALRNMPSEEQQAAAQLALSWGWHDQSIRSALQSGAMDDLELRFPFAYRESFSGAAKSAELPMNWLYAISRQESAFVADARSSAGALGLMQLMPATAQHLSQQLRLKYNQQQLLQPKSNIHLGSTYLRDLLRRFGDNRVLASAAYNAGPGRISRVLRDQPDAVSADIWIETLPYRETREYVQNVLTFAAIYAHRLGKPRALLAAHETSIGTAPALQVGSAIDPGITP